MRTALLFAVALGCSIGLTACGGGSGGSAQPPPTGATPTPTPTQTPTPTGSVVLSLTIPVRASSAARRSPLFVSPNVRSVALYDGSALIYVANIQSASAPPVTTVYAASGPTSVTASSCTTSASQVTCTVTLTTAAASHDFDAVFYPNAQSSPNTSTPPVLTGVIASEGQVSVVVSPGTTTAATIVPLGVADAVVEAGNPHTGYNQAAQFTFQVLDSTGVQITQPPSAYDNGPVTITASPPGIVTISPATFATPPPSPGDQTFAVVCSNQNGGTATIAFAAQTHPNASYASGLTYSSSNYAPSPLATLQFTCDPGVGTGNIHITSKRVRP